MPTLEETVQQFAEENKRGFRKLRIQMRNSKAEYEKRRAEYAEQAKEQAKEEAKRKAEYDERQKKRDIEYEQIEKRLVHQERNYGRFTESFVRHQLIRVLGEIGIEISFIDRNRIREFADGTRREFDAIAVNGDVAVFVEVKSTLQQNEIEYFVQKMKRIRELFPEYKDKKIVAAVAFIHDAEGAIEMAHNVGLLTILATASSAKITNPTGFEPRAF